MNHSTNIVWGERGELFLHEKALRAYFCAGVHIILARIVVVISCLDSTIQHIALIENLLNKLTLDFSRYAWLEKLSGRYLLL